MPLHAGISSTRFTREVLCGSLPPLRPLVLTLKDLLARHGLDCGYSGGLNSYALVLMAASIMHRQAPEHSVGVLLLRFLELFGPSPAPQMQMFVALDGRPPRIVPRELSGHAADGHAPLVVRDPLDAANNVGSGCFAFHLMQAMLRDTLVRLERELQDESSTGERILDALIGPSR